MPLAADDPGSDRRAPILGSLRFDPPEISDGSVTTLFIDVTDDLSGVKTVSGNLRSPGGMAVLPFAAQGEAGSSVFAVRITIPRHAETGVWYVANLQVLDRASNPLIESFTAATIPPGGTVRISSADSDSAAPEVRGVSVEKGVLRDGERNLIRVEVEDDRSGVASVTGAFRSPSRSALVGFSGSLNGESGFWEGVVPIPVNAECGEWNLQQLRVADKANNVAYFSSGSPPLGRVAFVVSNPSDCDSSPPTLETFYLSPTIVSSETSAEILVTAAIRDEGSGAESVSGRVDGPVSTNGQVPRIYFSCARNANDPEAPWTGKILVPQYAAKGTWKVASVQVQDSAHNTHTYTSGDSAIADVSFEIE